MSTAIVLKNVRIAYANGLAEAFVGADGKVGNFGATFILPKDHPQLPEIYAAITKEVKEKFKDKWELVLKGIKATDKLPIHDGDLKEDNGFAGNFYIRAGRKTTPMLVNQQLATITADSGLIYSGCWVNIKIDIYAYDKGSNGVTASLTTVQLVKDGESFGGGGSVSNTSGLEAIAPAELSSEEVEANYF